MDQPTKRRYPIIMFSLLTILHFQTIRNRCRLVLMSFAFSLCSCIASVRIVNAMRPSHPCLSRRRAPSAKLRRVCDRETASSKYPDISNECYSLALYALQRSRTRTAQTRPQMARIVGRFQDMPAVATMGMPSREVRSNVTLSQRCSEGVRMTKGSPLPLTLLPSKHGRAGHNNGPRLL